MVSSQQRWLRSPRPDSRRSRRRSPAPRLCRSPAPGPARTGRAAEADTVQCRARLSSAPLFAPAGWRPRHAHRPRVEQHDGPTDRQLAIRVTQGAEVVPSGRNRHEVLGAPSRLDVQLDGRLARGREQQQPEHGWRRDLQVRSCVRTNRRAPAALHAAWCTRPPR